MILSTAQLLNEVRRVAQLPTSTANSLTNDDLLSECQRALEASVLPFVARFQEEFFVLHQTYPVPPNSMRFTIPRRAMGNGIRDVFLENRQASGPLNPGVLTPMGRIRPEQAADFRNGNPPNLANGMPRYFYLEANTMVLSPPPTQPAWLRFGIPVRPGQMSIVTSSARQIATVNQTGPNAVAITFATGLSLVSGNVDVIASRPPFEYLGMNIIATAITGTSMTLQYAQETANSLLRIPEVGDWLTISELSPVVQLPSEAQQLLVQRGAEYCLRYLGYIEEAQAAYQLAVTMEKDLQSILTPRTEGNPRKVVGGLQKLIGRGPGYGGYLGW